MILMLLVSTLLQKVKQDFYQNLSMGQIFGHYPIDLMHSKTFAESSDAILAALHKK